MNNDFFFKGFGIFYTKTQCFGVSKTVLLVTITSVDTTLDGQFSVITTTEQAEKNG